MDVHQTAWFCCGCSIGRKARETGGREVRWGRRSEDRAAMTDSTLSPPCLHVLAVDDCLIDRKIVEKILKSGGLFKVTSVDSAKKAMEVLGLNEEVDGPTNTSDNQIDIILTDYCMPEMTGYDLLKMVKEHSRLKSIPVVIMSSENEPQRIKRCLSEGAEDFILKPLQLAHVNKLRSYARPATSTAKATKKRKLPPDILPENETERRPRLTGVAVA
ncbi:two-component response regulator ORR9-like [Nymphaea colorata]|nr:two-component response regulator ORR9-like [Nymphaea colorata]